jgi:hypothetical protein
MSLSWNDFRSQHAGKGISRAEMSNIYQDQKGSESVLKVASESKKAKKSNKKGKKEADKDWLIKYVFKVKGALTADLKGDLESISRYALQQDSQYFISGVNGSRYLEYGKASLEKNKGEQNIVTVIVSIPKKHYTLRALEDFLSYLELPYNALIHLRTSGQKKVEVVSAFEIVSDKKDVAGANDRNEESEQDGESYLLFKAASKK